MDGRKMAASILAILLFLTGTGVATLADERILRFDSTIGVSEDGSLRVTEVITVRSEGDQIKRGIYRDFPTHYKGDWGFNISVPFTVIEVLRNGRPDAYHIEDIEIGKRVYIGDKDAYLNPDIYTYSLTYTTNFQLGFTREYAELYWNVTGNDWAFPIDSASARVLLPPGAEGRVISYEAYTGPKGGKGSDYTALLDSSGAPSFASSKILNPGEGLTIAVRWPAGIISPPEAGRMRERFIRDNLGALSGMAGVLLVLLYYFIVWVIAGRDPRRGVIIPLYDSPENLSPAALRFIDRMGYDDRAFAAAIVGMAVRGHCTIAEKGGVYTVRATGKDQGDLAPEEKKLVQKLFVKKDSITLKNDNHSTISTAIKAVRRSLVLNYEKKYFISNMGYFVPGLVISLLFIIAAFVLGVMESPETAMLIWLTFWSVGVAFLLWKVITAWRGALVMKNGFGKLFASGGAVFLTLFSLPFVGAEIAVLFFYLQMGSPWLLLSTVSIMLLNLLFYQLLKAPTRSGRSLMDRIEGFRLFLRVTERDRLNAVMPPEKTPETFERFLPYAIALGVENRWAEYFSDTLSDATKAGTYSPSWYRGPSLASIGMSGLAGSFGRSFSGAISSSATAPGSGSGGGGGGSSGGWGGGGGGGGW